MYLVDASIDCIEFDIRDVDETVMSAGFMVEFVRNFEITESYFLWIFHNGRYSNAESLSIWEIANCKGFERLKNAKRLNLVTKRTFKIRPIVLNSIVHFRVFLNKAESHKAVRLSLLFSSIYRYHIILYPCDDCTVFAYR